MFITPVERGAAADRAIPRTQRLTPSGRVPTGPRSHRPGPTGPAFVLLDMMIALAVATLVLLSAFSLVIASVAALNVARQNAVAYNAARQITENVRLYKAAPLANGTYPDVTVFGPVPQLAQLSGGAASLTIATYRGAVKSVTVSVSWRAGERSKARQRAFVTLVAPQGVTP